MEIRTSIALKAGVAQATVFGLAVPEIGPTMVPPWAPPPYEKFTQIVREVGGSLAVKSKVTLCVVPPVQEVVGPGAANVADGLATTCRTPYMSPPGA